MTTGKMRSGCALMFLMLLGAGCATVRRVDVTIVEAQPGGQVRPGMTRDQVRSALSRPIVMGYDVDPVSGQAVPATLNGPYSTEIMAAGGTTYLVDRYLTGGVTVGQPVSETALVPMVFKDNILIGQGQEALDRIQLAGPGEK